MLVAHFLHDGFSASTDPPWPMFEALHACCKTYELYMHEETHEIKRILLFSNTEKNNPLTKHTHTLNTIKPNQVFLPTNTMFTSQHHKMSTETLITIPCCFLHASESPITTTQWENHQPFDLVNGPRCYNHQAVNLYISQLLPGTLGRLRMDGWKTSLCLLGR